jgi:hypothetical protein
MSLFLIAVLILFVGVNLVVLAFCRSAALADRKLESLHVRRVIDCSTAVTKPTGKRTSNDPAAGLQQSRLLP